jgi:transcriptional regulator with XRE-family HTH domain
MTMQTNDRNIYQAARKAAGLTQERAAELLNLSVESLRAYETDGRMPSSDVVEAMIDLYGVPVLAVQHIRASAAMARALLPEVQEMGLPQAAVRLINRIYQFADHHRDRALMRIAEDGVIDENEKPEFDQITEELDGIMQAAMELRCARKGEHK